MALAPIFGSNISPTGLVDNLVGDAFPIVRHVSTNMEYVKHVSANLPQIYRVWESVSNLDVLFDNIEIIDDIHGNLNIFTALYNDFSKLNVIFTNMNMLNELHADQDKYISIYTNRVALLNLEDNLTELYAARDFIDTFGQQFGNVQSAIDAAEAYAQDALENATGLVIANQADAEGGSNNTHALTALGADYYFNIRKATQASAELGSGFGWMDAERTRQAIKAFGALDIRQFAEGVSLGNETKDTDALTLGWKEIVSRPLKQDGITLFNPNSGAAIATTPMKLFIPPNGLIYGGTGLTDTDSGILNYQGSFGIVGCGSNSSRITQTDPNSILIDINSALRSCHFEDFSLKGGKGLYRNRKTAAGGGLAAGRQIFHNIAFYDTSQVGLQSNDPDEPFWSAQHCKYYGLAGSRFCIVPPGSGHVIAHNWLISYFIGIQVITGKGVLVNNNRFGGAAADSAGTPITEKFDIWLQPLIGDTTAGSGVKLTNNDHGGENDNVADSPILIADVDVASGSDVGTRLPLRSASTSLLRGMLFDGNRYSAGSGNIHGVIRSYTPRIGSSVFDEYIEGDYPYYFEFPAHTDTGVGNKYAGTNIIRIRGGLNFDIGKKMKVANIPGLGVAYDPGGVLVNDRTTVRGVLPKATPTLITPTMASLVAQATTATVTLGQTDREAGTEAALIQFNSNIGRARLPLNLANIKLDRIAYFTFDVKAAPSQSCDECKVYVGKDTSNYFLGRRVVAGSDWYSVEPIPLPFPVNSPDPLWVYIENIDPNWAAGVKDRVLFARARIEQY